MISARGLRKTYYGEDGRVDARDGVDLEVQEGEFVAIIGSSGSGKSTLMNLLGLLDRPDSGSYELYGRNMFKMSDKKLSKIRGREIGFVFQSYNLITRLTALENVELPQIFSGASAVSRRKSAKEALARVGLSDRMTHKPSQMSGGQQQRVAIARALIGRPKLILADEPTGNLDEVSTSQILALLKGLNNAGVTILLITHDKDVALHAGRIIRVHAGRVIGDTRRSSM